MFITVDPAGAGEVWLAIILDELDGGAGVKMAVPRWWVYPPLGGLFAASLPDQDIREAGRQPIWGYDAIIHFGFSSLPPSLSPYP